MIDRQICTEIVCNKRWHQRLEEGAVMTLIFVAHNTQLRLSNAPGSRDRMHIYMYIYAYANYIQTCICIHLYVCMCTHWKKGKNPTKKNVRFAVSNEQQRLLGVEHETCFLPRSSHDTLEVAFQRLSF